MKCEDVQVPALLVGGSHIQTSISHTAAKQQADGKGHQETEKNN